MKASVHFVYCYELLVLSINWIYFIFLFCVGENISQDGIDTTTFEGKFGDVDYFGDLKRACTICLPPTVDSAEFYGTIVMFHYFK